MSNLEALIIRVGKKAVKVAQKESWNQGVANVYSKNKRLYFQLPDGTITQHIPQEYKGEALCKN